MLNEILRIAKEAEKKELIRYDYGRDQYVINRWFKTGVINLANKEYMEKNFNGLVEIGNPYDICGTTCALTFLKKNGSALELNLKGSEDLEKILELFEAIEAVDEYEFVLYMPLARYEDILEKLLDEAIQNLRKDIKELKRFSDFTIELALVNLGYEENFMYGISEDDLLRELGIERKAI